MKADERILELLAEYLQKTDRLLERMVRTDKNVDIMSKALLEQGGETKSLREDQGVMLKELLSISK